MYPSYYGPYDDESLWSYNIRRKGKDIYKDCTTIIIS